MAMEFSGLIGELAIYEVCQNLQRLQCAGAFSASAASPTSEP